MATVIIHTNTLNFEQSKTLERKLGKLTLVNNHFRATVDVTPEKSQLAELSQTLQLDINLMPENFDAASVQLLISDMDSTLINIECVDEIADFINVKPQVAAITEAAMRGELNFEESLIERVSLLKGLETSALQHVYDNRLGLNPGAETWIDGLKQNGVKFALVSGGFTFFTQKLQERLGIDFTRANVLSIEHGQLTGTLEGAIVGPQAKADFLIELCEQMEILMSQTIAVGDGANDLMMMQEAGLSVAYHAKPAVQEQADTALNFRGLDAILDFID